MTKQRQLVLQRRLKKKQSDRIVQSILDGTSLDELRTLISELKKEEREALEKKEAKAQSQNAWATSSFQRR